LYNGQRGKALGIVLASGSPRRIELLKMIGLEDFKVIPDTSDEHLTPGLSPDEQVNKLALQKAENVSFSCDKDDVIIAADTLVYLGGEPLGKPESRLDAEVMLGKLSGRKHTVYTGIALLRSDTHVTCTEKTDVYFRKISPGEIAAYAETDEPMDKAGSYAAQGRGALFVERIEGDFFNIMGLPLCRLFLMLKDFGVIV
jgi:septum formation protein